MGQDAHSKTRCLKGAPQKRLAGSGDGGLVVIVWPCGWGGAGSVSECFFRPSSMLRSEEVAPLSTDFSGHTVWELPPNGQGLVALLALNILREQEVV